MINTLLNIQEFIKLAEEYAVIDVRSPSEFEQGHIPGAYNIPLFDNEERAKVGTAYKQISRQKAIEIGYELANPKSNSFIKRIEEILNNQQSNNRTNEYSNSEPKTTNHQPQTVLVHCWRGGMRSSKFAEMLNKHGYKTHTLVKGYKAYRNFVLESFAHDVYIFIVGGETGSGKTEILKKISELGEQVIDLEAIAHHKGSAFGSLGEKPQPTHEQFENDLSHQWMAAVSPLSGGEGLPRRQAGQGVRLWLEDESRNIGKTQIPLSIWQKMKQAPIFRVNIPRQLRIDRLVNEYGKFSKQELASCILRIERRLGPQHAKHALEELEKGNLKEVAEITLAYYDRAYNYNHELRKMKDVFIVDCATDDASENANRVIGFANQKFKMNYV